MNPRTAAELAVRELEPTSYASLEASKLCTNEEIIYGRNALIRRLDRMTEIISRHIEAAILEDRVAARIGMTHRKAWVCAKCGDAYVTDHKPSACETCWYESFHEGELSYSVPNNPLNS